MSATADTLASTIEINDDSPAKTSEPKNSTPNTGLGPGSSEMIEGNTTKARPTPSVATSATDTPLLAAKNPRAANTPRPASSSKELLANPAMKALLVRSVRRGR